MANGKVVLKLGNDISTDIIYPGRFMATVLPTETPQYAFADDAGFNQMLNSNQVPAGSFIVAGDNFGCGSSREQAASCIKGYGLTVVARNFARIFLQNPVALALTGRSSQSHVIAAADSPPIGLLCYTAKLYNKGHPLCSPIGSA